MITNFKPKGSNRTTPLTKEQFDFILAEFMDKNDNRMAIICHLMFRCCRIGDILRTIKVNHIFEDDGTVKEQLRYYEEKTEKLRIIPLKGNLFESALRAYWSEVRYHDYYGPMFFTKKTHRPLIEAGIKKHLRNFVHKRGIKQCSPHSFRKAGARYMFQNNVRIEHICDVLNHHSTRITEIYIDITPRDVQQAMKCLEI